LVGLSQVLGDSAGQVGNLSYITKNLERTQVGGDVFTVLGESENAGDHPKLLPLIGKV